VYGRAFPLTGEDRVSGPVAGYGPGRVPAFRQLQNSFDNRHLLVARQAAPRADNPVGILNPVRPTLWNTGQATELLPKLAGGDKVLRRIQNSSRPLTTFHQLRPSDYAKRITGALQSSRVRMRCVKRT